MSGFWLGGSLLEVGLRTMTDSSDRVSGWTSAPSRCSNEARGWSSVKPVELCSSRRPMGDQPAILPATTPAIAAAGAKAEFARDLPRRRVIDRRESGVRGGARLLPLSPSICSGLGDCGRELVRDLDPLRERGKRVSRGCCSLYTSILRRPPRKVLRIVSSSRISTKAGFHSICRSSSETRSCGVARLCNQEGTSLRHHSSGIQRISTAIGSDSSPSSTAIPHAGALWWVIVKAAPPTEMINTCPPTIMN